MNNGGRSRELEDGRGADDDYVNEDQYSFHGRWSKVLDAMLSVIDNYPRRDIMPYPLMDTMRLLYAKPCIISFIRVGKARINLLQSSFRDREYFDKFYEDMFGSQSQAEFTSRNATFLLCDDVHFCVHKFRVDGTGQLTGFLGLSPEFRKLSLKQAVKEGGDAYDFHLADHLSNGFQNRNAGKALVALRKVFKELLPIPNDRRTRQRQSAGSHKVVPSAEFVVPNADEIRAILAPMREITDFSDAEFGEGFFRRNADRESAGPINQNLFCVVQHVLPDGSLRRSYFDYTARLLLGAEQRKSIHSWLRAAGTKSKLTRTLRGIWKEWSEIIRKDPDAAADMFVEVLETPLGRGYRSIADTVFCSGVTDISSEDALTGRDGCPGHDKNAADENRRKTEEMVYGQFKRQPLFYAPVHVGGIPWMAVFTFPRIRIKVSPEDAPTTCRIWEYNYRFYRDLLPLAARRIRAGTRRIYLEHVRNIFAQALRTQVGSQFFIGVQREWRKLAAVFPYGCPVISPISPDGRSIAISLPSVGDAWISLLPNPNSCFANPLNFDLMKLEEISAVCRNAVEDQERSLLEISVAQSATWTHDVKNATEAPYDELQMAENADSVDKMMSHIRRAKNWIMFLHAMANVRNAISKHHRSSTEAPPGSKILSGIERKTVERLLSAIFQYLLASHAELNADLRLTISHPPGCPVYLPEEAVKEIRSLLDVEIRSLGHSDLRHIPDDRAVFTANEVVWPMAFLREIVQNIKIGSPIESGGVHVSYSWATDGRDLLLKIVQNQIETKRWNIGPYDLFPGLILANTLYGEANAGFGGIEMPAPRTQELCHDAKGDNAVSITYPLTVRFFRIAE